MEKRTISKVFNFLPQEINNRIALETVTLEKNRNNNTLTNSLVVSSFFRMNKLIFNTILIQTVLYSDGYQPTIEYTNNPGIYYKEIEII